MTNKELASRAQGSLLGNYGVRDMALVRGEGTRVWDADDNEYIDFVAGIAVNNVGHCHPAVVEAVREQIGRLIHVSNLYLIEPQIRLAELLTQHTFADKCFFCNSGAEANEAAVKLARRATPKGRYKIICMEKSFHGRTLAMTAATGQRGVKTKGFEPLPAGFVHVPFNDLQAVRKMVDGETCAVMTEPVLGEGGILVPDPCYLAGLRDICSKNGLLLILDEVQTGFGRTGRLFAYEHSGIKPDVITIAKGMAGGLPMGGILVAKKHAKVLCEGSHASTFGGSPVVAAAACAVLEAILAEGLVERSAEMGAYLVERLNGLCERHEFAVGARGLGLMCALELKDKAKWILPAAAKRGILLNCVQESILRLAPPLTITREDIDRLIEVLDTVLEERPTDESSTADR